MSRLVNENYTFGISILAKNSRELNLGIDVFSFSVGARYSIVVGRTLLDNFAGALHQIYETANGYCELRQNQETCFVAVSANGTEQVTISGEYIDLINQGNQCQFRFKITKHQLAELIQNVEAMLEI